MHQRLCESDPPREQRPYLSKSEAFVGCISYHADEASLWGRRMELTTGKSRDERWRESWHQMNHRFLTFSRPDGIPGFLWQPRRCAAWVSLPNPLHSAVGECGPVGLLSPPQLVSRDQALPKKSPANLERGWELRPGYSCPLWISAPQRPVGRPRLYASRFEVPPARFCFLPTFLSEVSHPHCA